MNKKYKFSIIKRVVIVIFNSNEKQELCILTKCKYTNETDEGNSWVRLISERA